VSADGFSSTEVATLAPCSYRRLDWWLRTGIATASVDPGEGCGSKRRFSLADLIAVAVVAGFSDRNLLAPGTFRNKGLPLALHLAAEEYGWDLAVVLVGTHTLLGPVDDAGEMLERAHMNPPIPGVTQVASIVLTRPIHDRILTDLKETPA
jgi:hypothetical protein